MEKKRILILGVGNILLGDEGFGVHAMRHLEENYIWPDNIRLLDGGTLGLLLMGELMETDLAIILDIAHGGHEPGTFYELDGAELQKYPGLHQSAHQTGIEDVLVSCSLAGHRPETIIFAMEPFSYNQWNPELTGEATSRLPFFCEKVLSRLAERNIRPVYSNNPPHP